MYIKPPIKKNLHSYDLIKYNREHFVVLTHACDIVVQGYIESEGGIHLPIRNLENIIIVKTKDFNYKITCLTQKINWIKTILRVLLRIRMLNSIIYHLLDYIAALQLISKIQLQFHKLTNLNGLPLYYLHLSKTLFQDFRTIIQGRSTYF